MQPRIAICNRCGGMKLGWNRRYISHWLRCKGWLRKSSKAGRAAIVLALILGCSKPSVSISPAPKAVLPVQGASAPMTVVAVAPDVRSMNAFLKLHKVDEANRGRLAESIVASARKYDLNPRLLASIMIVESRGNPFAISGQQAVGIMQIHLPTWGNTADRENINLLKIEDNVDFGAHILKNYVRRYGLSEGVKRYNGFIPGEPTWEESSQRYLAKVQRVYELEQTSAAQEKPIIF
jgi:soluble lytic murein transglycosylase-like protein